MSRRIAVVVGLLFGLGLVALVVAGRAGAEEHGDSARPADVAAQDGGGSLVGGLGQLTEPLTAPLLGSVTDTVEPVVDAVVEPVAPLVRAGAEVLAPVVRPVTSAVAPVTAPLLSPVLDAAKPVVPPPLEEATGLTEVTDAGSGGRSQDAAAPVDLPSPTPSAASGTESSVLPGTRAVAPVVHQMTSPAAAAVATHTATQAAPGSPGPPPRLPSGPVPFAVTGGGVAGGTGSVHGGDTVVVGGAGGVVGQWTSSGRGPPGTIVGTSWFGYDDRDHPS